MLSDRGQDDRLEKATVGLFVHIETDDERAEEDFDELATQRFNIGVVEQALSVLNDCLVVSAALAPLWLTVGFVTVSTARASE